MTFDPRTIGKYVYEELNDLRKLYDQALDNQQSPLDFDIYEAHLKEQKSQAVELYTYLSTWGLMRLRAEEISLNKWNPQNPPTIHQRAMKSQEGKREVIKSYFQCLQKISEMTNLSNEQGLDTLKDMGINQYLGITGLGLAVAQEFSFWASAVYYDIQGGDSD